MESAEYKRLQRGDGIVIRFATNGTQYALVWGRVKDGSIVVCKWQEKSGRWTKPIMIDRTSVLRRARFGEYKADPIPTGIWGSPTGRLKA